MTRLIVSKTKDWSNINKEKPYKLGKDFTNDWSSDSL